MKSFTAIAIATLAATVASQSIADLPKCALSCLATGIGSTKCQITELECACSKEKFVKDSKVCIDSSCQGDDIQKALKTTIALCNNAGVDIEKILNGDKPAESSAPAASSAPAQSSAPAASSAPAQSSAPAASSAASSGAPKPSSNGTAPSSTPTAPPFEGAASKMGAAGSLLALGLAVAAAF